MLTRFRRSGVLGALACLSLGSAAAGGRQPRDTDWQVPTGNDGSQRYAPLDQIDRSNFDELEIAWRWSSPDNELMAGDAGQGGRRMRPRNHESIPIKVGDRLYVTTGYGQIAAVDIEEGTNLWTYDPQAYTHGRPTNLGFVHRGAAYWNDPDLPESGGRLIWAAGDAVLRAVDTLNGEPIVSFGDGGAVDLTLGLRREVARRAYSVSSPVVLCRDVAIVGSSISDGPRAPEAPPGDVRGFDVRTGEQLWAFHSIPQEDEPGRDTWEDGSWKHSGNTNVWTLMSVDQDLGLAYLPFGTPTNDWYGGHRLGDNLYAESLVAVDCETGRRRWHFQMVHHGLWDYDLPTSAILGDIEVEGRRIRAAMQLSKQGSSTSSTPKPASRSGRSRNGRFRRPASPANGRRRLSPSPRSRRRSNDRASPWTISPTSRRRSAPPPGRSSPSTSTDPCSRRRPSAAPG